MRNRYAVIRLALLAALVCAACFALTLLVNGTPRMLARLAGLERVGRLEDVLPSDTSPLILDGSELDHVQPVFPPHLTEPLTLTATGLNGGSIIGDASTPGTTTYLVTVDETSVNRLLRRWALPDESSEGRYRHIEVDLQAGGLVLYAEADVGLRWVPVGLLLLPDGETPPTLAPVGLALNQQIYRLPDNGSLARWLLPDEIYARHNLDALVIVGPLPGRAHVKQVRFHDDRLEVLAQATYEAQPPPDTGWQSLEPGVELREIDVAVGPERPTERLRIVRLDPAAVRFRVCYDPANPRTVSAWAAQMESMLVVNAGYFAPETEAGTETAGLLVSEGQRWGTPLGDFAGMFAVAGDGDVSVRWLQEQPYDPGESLLAAVQSFPVLVKPGGTVGFPPGADHGARARRTVVAQDRNGDILIIVAPGWRLSLHDLASFLAKSDLAVDVALNLDGGGSTGLRLAAGEAGVEIDSLTPVPSVIVAERR